MAIILGFFLRMDTYFTEASVGTSAALKEKTQHNFKQHIERKRQAERKGKLIQNSLNRTRIILDLHHLLFRADIGFFSLGEIQSVSVISQPQTAQMDPE